MSEHYFKHGTPVSGEDFINRENDLKDVFGRLRNGEPSAIVGEPHIGKTSLLHHMQRPETRRHYLGEDDGQFLFQFIDVYDYPSDYAPPDFWDEALEPLDDIQDATIRQSLETARKARFERRTLNRLFKHLKRRNLTLVLLLDEFETLITHPNFRNTTLFASMRSINGNVRSLNVVLASRKPLARLNDTASGEGSPYFNQLTDLILKPFDDAAVAALLAPGDFTAEQQDFIRVFAGRHPYLLQAMAQAVQTYPQDLHRAARTFYERTASHYHDIWKYLDNDHRLVALLLALMAFDGQARGHAYNYGEIENADTFQKELKDLADVGLAEHLPGSSSLQWDAEHYLLWRGGRWRIGALAFAWWLRDQVFPRYDPLPEISGFLQAKRYRGFLTQEQWDALTESARKFTPDLRSLAKLVLQHLGRKE